MSWLAKVLCIAPALRLLQLLLLLLSPLCLLLLLLLLLLPCVSTWRNSSDGSGSGSKQVMYIPTCPTGRAV